VQFCLLLPQANTNESPTLQHRLEQPMATPKSILEKMIAAMNRGSDAAKNAVLKAKDIDMFEKPIPKRKSAR
jgi:hypothetical protein